MPVSRAVLKLLEVVHMTAVVSDSKSLKIHSAIIQLQMRVLKKILVPSNSTCVQFLSQMRQRMIRVKLPNPLLNKQI